MIDIEQEFIGMRENYLHSKRNATSCKDVLRYMVEQYENKRWHWSWEFVGKYLKNGKMLSHRAPARASDLALHTELVEDRKIGRFKVYRVRKEKREEVLNYLK